MMKRLPMILLAISVSALAVLFSSFSPPSASAAGCGPGSHWIDTCPAGTDDLGTTTVGFGIDTNDDCIPELSLSLTGPVTVDRAAASDVSANFGGVGSVDSHLDVIDTEIMTMTMTGGGFTMKVGTSTSGINAGVPQSLGAIEELSGDALLADSFFEVFFEADDGTNPKTYNQTALLLTANPSIDRVPPETDYASPISGCVDLWTAPIGGFDTGVNLVADGHHEVGVGGIAEVVSGGSVASPASDAGGSGSSAGLYAAIASGIAASVVAAGAGGWYARRRFAYRRIRS